MKINEIYLELLKNCNLRCTHCYIPEKTSRFLSKKEWFKILDIIKKCFDSKHIVLLGGEPLIHPDFYDILAYAISKFEDVSVQTNGTLPSSFANYECNVTISFESCLMEENDSIRKFKDCERSVYELAVKKLSAGKKFGANTTCRFTLYNDTDILASIIFAEKMNSNAVFVPLMSQGCAESLVHRIPSAKKIKESIQICIEANEKMRGNHQIQIPQWYMINSSLFEKHKLIFAKNKRICPAGINRLFISSNSNIYPCMFLPQFKLGNLLNDKIQVIESKISAFNDKIKNIKPSKKCQQCDAFNICGGGCISEFIKNKERMGETCPLK